MDMMRNWDQIKITFDAAISSSHCAVATIGSDGFPDITPIGFIFLRDDYSAFYFEEHAHGNWGPIWIMTPGFACFWSTAGPDFGYLFYCEEHFLHRLGYASSDMRGDGEKRPSMSSGRCRRGLNPSEGCPARN